MSIDILVIEKWKTHPPGAFLEVVLGRDRGIEAELARQRSPGCHRGMAAGMFLRILESPGRTGPTNRNNRRYHHTQSV